MSARELRVESTVAVIHVNQFYEQKGECIPASPQNLAFICQSVSDHKSYAHSLVPQELVSRV